MMKEKNDNYDLFSFPLNCIKIIGVLFFLVFILSFLSELLDGNAKKGQQWGTTMGSHLNY